MSIPERLVRALLHRKVVPFLGAGFSIPSGVPTWSRLISDLVASDSSAAEAAQMAPQLSLPDVAEVLDSLNVSEHYALSFFDDRIADPRFRPNAYHDALVALRPSVIITTNWDTLIEDHFRDRGNRVTVITRDADVPLFDEHQHVNILKIHGTITDLSGLVYRKSQYETYWSSRPLLRSLLNVLLSTHHSLFIGYGFGDPNIVELLSTLAGTSGRFRREHWSLSYSDLQFHSIWQRLGVTTVVGSERADDGDFVRPTVSFLKEMLSASGSIASSNLERANLVNRELSRQVQGGRPATVLRMRAQLGWLSNPQPVLHHPVYGNADQDAAEQQMTERVKEFLFCHPGNRVRNIVNVTAGGLLRKYTVEASRRRLEALRDNITELGHRVEVVHADQENNMNEMIFDDSALLIGYKVPSRVGISRVTMHHDLSTVRHHIEQFDADFFEIVEHSTNAVVPEALDLARGLVLEQIDRTLSELAGLSGKAGGPVAPEPDVTGLATALAVAVQYHDAAGQTREDGVTPYWVHVFRVLERLRQAVAPFTTELGVSALLHDLVEDTDVTIVEVANMFGSEVAEIVDCLTQREGMSFDAYLQQLAEGPATSRIVKLADRADNVVELTRMQYLSYGGVLPTEYVSASERVLSVCGSANDPLAAALHNAILEARDIFRED